MAFLRPGRRRRTLGAVAAAVVATAVPVHARAPRAGDPAPRLTLARLAGGTMQLDELGGKTIVLDFWASWCTRCTPALPKLDALARRHGAAGVVVVAVSIDDSAPTARRFLDEVAPGAVMTVLHDPGGRALAALGVTGVPALLVIDATGVVRLVASGYEPERIEAVERLVTTLTTAPTATPH